MNFAILEDSHMRKRDILVIGRTIEREGQKYHIVGMTLSDEAKIYILEPCAKPENSQSKRIQNLRRILKEHDQHEYRYFNCSNFCLGNRQLEVQGGIGGPLAPDDYESIQLFSDMLSAGWLVPEWLRDTDWDNLALLSITLAPGDSLPQYTPDMPITITHKPAPTRHLLEKTVTLCVGKSRSLHFMDNLGEDVKCYINHVTLIDVWEDTKKEFEDPKLAEKFSPEQIEEMKGHSYNALEQNCPKGMCYIGIEYECEKDFNLVFYSKEYLSSRPETHKGSSSFVMMRLTPDKKTGQHNLPLKGCVIHTPVSPDTIKIPAELFLYYEPARPWTETV